MTWGEGLLLAFCIFNLLCLLACWLLLRAGQKALDRRFEMDEKEWQEALRRLAP